MLRDRQGAAEAKIKVPASAFRTGVGHTAENKWQIQRHANLIALGRRPKLCPPPLALALLLALLSEPNGVTVAEFWSI
jgi:hypothetical protein